MTITMPDSINPALLPPGYPAYLGYVDGQWPTASAVAQRSGFKARIVTLTVLGGDTVADGFDCEPGNPNAEDAARWVAWRISQGAHRPIVYASVGGVPGYGMPDVLRDLAAWHVTRDKVRLLSAHYTETPHICGPASCGAIDIDMDGTQWTSSFPGIGGAPIDMSELRDDFFTLTPVTGWTEFDMSRLPQLEAGASDKPGSFFYVHRLQALVTLTGKLNNLPAAAALIDDGTYGQPTIAAVEAVQAHYKITEDGICGPQTWSVLLTGAV